MTPEDFFFALVVSGGTSRDMLNELAGRVLERVGSPGNGAADLGGAIHAAIVQGSGGSAAPIDVQFRAGGGRLMFVFSSRSGEIWRGTHEIP